MATFRVTGIENVSKALQRLAQQVPVQAAQALNASAESTMTDAKIRTPVDTGTLRRSGKVHQHATPRKLSAELSFGTEYGVFVHENIRARHPNGEAKFLERAIQKTAVTFEKDIAAEILALLRKP